MEESGGHVVSRNERHDDDGRSAVEGYLTVYRRSVLTVAELAERLRL